MSSKPENDALDYVESLQARVSVLEGERDRAVEALKSIAVYSAPPHPHAGCGIDACLGCLIESTARAALESLSGEGAKK